MKASALPLALWLGVLAFTSVRAEEPAVPSNPSPFVPVHVQIGPDGIERTPPAALKPVPGGPPLPTENLFGTWCDFRPALEHGGFTPAIGYIADLAGNPVGGRRQGFTDADEITLSVGLDLERLGGLHGAKAAVSLISRSGSSLTDDFIDNLFQTQQEFGGSTWHMASVWFEQSLLNDRFNIRLGRLTAGDEFLVSPYAALFMQSSVNGTPDGILFDAPGMTTAPISTWGARFTYRPWEEFSVMTGIYDGNPNVALNSMNGLDFTMRGPLFWITEVCYSLNGRKGATGLPGHYKAGIWYNDGSFEVFTPFVGAGGNIEALQSELARKLRLDRFVREFSAPRRWGDFGFYAMMDQILWRRGKQDICMFGAILVAPEYAINQMPYFGEIGVVCHGPIPCRPLDIIGFQLSGGSISPVLRRAQKIEQLADPRTPVQSSELVLEAFYNIHVAPGLLFQPDVQYIINPGAAGQYPNAVVLGVQLTLNF